MTIVILNQKAMPASSAQFNPLDRGLQLGHGLFTTLRAEQGRLYDWPAHWQRLQYGLKALTIDLPDTEPMLKQQLFNCLKHNQLENQSAGLRLTITAGPAERGLVVLPTQPTVLIQSFAIKNKLPPCSCQLVRVRKDERGPFARIKTLNYLDNILAKQQALKQNADEALLLNHRGRMAEASSSNLFIVQHGVLKTPAIAEGAMPGIMRQVILQQAKRLAIPYFVGPLRLTDCLNAEEAFLSNSLIGLRPIKEINQHPLPYAAIVTQQLQNACQTREDL